MATLEELLVSIGIDTEELTTGAQGAADDVESSLGGIGALGAGAAVGGLFAMGLANAMDASAANTKLANQLGLSEQEAARAGDVAGEVFSAGFGESIDGVNESIQSVVSAMGGMGNVTDDELKSMTTSALMLASTFEIDVADAATSAGALINNGLAKDGKEAFDVLTTAAQNLPKSMLEDIPATVTEYGKHWARIGLDAKDAFGMMSQYVKAGGRDIDQAGDVLHEFARITSEETDKAAAAFKGLGLPAKQMLADIHKGGEPAKAALQKTIEALRGVKDTGKQSALAVELFGDMAGEGADALWAMDPATAATSGGMEDVKGAAEKANAAMAASPAQSMESIMRTLATTIGDMLGPALKIIGDFLKEHPTLIKVLVPILLGLALAIGIAVIAQWAWNTALWAFPGTWIIAGIIALIAIIVLIVVYWDEIAAATGRAWDWIVGKLSDVWDWITGKVGEVWDWITGKTGDAWDWITGKVSDAVDQVMGAVDFLGKLPGRVGGWLGDMVDWVAGLPGRIGRAASGMWDSIVSNFKNAVNQLIWMWNNLSFTLGGGSFMGISIPSVTLNTPDIPYLAAGGVTTGPTLAMIGEGAEQEAVLPLSKLDGMLRSVAGSVRSTGGQPREQRLVLEVVGAENEFTEFFRNVVRTKGGGDVVQFAEG
ncbi:phage tail tape measure protein [Streptomyces sp. NPDC056227]|uniref:phage tail tape measure protein n=1 Tax=Streptomyces sp. NPDC056227 TaxID=3345753 RepID=UPI0035E05616